MEMTLTDSLTQLSDDLWIADGEAVRFFTLPYTTRMTIVRLTDGRLFIHSPIRLTESLQRQIRALGDVRSARRIRQDPDRHAENPGALLTSGPARSFRVC